MTSQSSDANVTHFTCIRQLHDVLKVREGGSNQNTKMQQTQPTLTGILESGTHLLLHLCIWQTLDLKKRTLHHVQVFLK